MVQAFASNVQLERYYVARILVFLCIDQGKKEKRVASFRHSTPRMLVVFTKWCAAIRAVSSQRCIHEWVADDNAS